MSDAMTYGEFRRLMDALDAERSERQQAIDNALATSDAWWGEQCAVLQRQLDEARAEAAHEREVANEHLAQRHDAERERDQAQERERLAKMIAGRVQSERDEARAEVERLRTKLADRDA